MASQVHARYLERLPALFAAELARLEQRAQAGDAALRARLEQMAVTPVVALVRFEGEGGGELGLHASRSELRVAPQAPQAGFGYALALPVAAAAYGITLLERGGAEVAEAARGLAMLASATARALFSSASFAFELNVTDTPVLGGLRARIALGRCTLPAAPEFTLTVEYDELEDAHEAGIPPHQLFLAGKIKIDGDVAKAMLLGMTLAQLK
jgi:SCP-2 sterol transfer family protein